MLAVPFRSLFVFGDALDLVTWQQRSPCPISGNVTAPAGASRSGRPSTSSASIRPRKAGLQELLPHTASDAGLSCGPSQDSVHSLEDYSVPTVVSSLPDPVASADSSASATAAATLVTPMKPRQKPVHHKGLTRVKASFHSAPQLRAVPSLEHLSPVAREQRAKERAQGLASFRLTATEKQQVSRCVCPLPLGWLPSCYSNRLALSSVS